jgi:hypothetical protein
MLIAVLPGRQHLPPHRIADNGDFDHKDGKQHVRHDGFAANWSARI